MWFRGTLWRNIGLPVRFGPIDGRVVMFFSIWFFHWRLWTFVVAMLGVVALIWVERMGYTVPNIMRRTGVLVMGRHRPAQTDRRQDRSDQ